MDEATSNVDELSQKKILDVIEKQFKGCTVLSIAHRFVITSTVITEMFIISIEILPCIVFVLYFRFSYFCHLISIILKLYLFKLYSLKKKLLIKL